MSSVVSGGMMIVATVILGSVAVSFSSGISSFHSGLILILCVFSSYSIMLCLERNCENSVSLSAGISICFATSGMLCHSPSLMMAKKLSMSKVVLD